MAAGVRNVPRFLPTLTEIVRVPAPRRTVPVETVVDAGIDPDGILESVRTRIDAEMGELLRDAVAAAMLEQVDAIAARLRQEIEPLLQQSVADMVANEIAARRHG